MKELLVHWVFGETVFFFFFWPVIAVVAKLLQEFMNLCLGKYVGLLQNSTIFFFI